MRTIAIIDDEQRIRQLYQNYVEKWAKQNQVSVRIHLFASAEEFLFEYEENKDFQVILLDIEMKAISGVELAKRIRQRDDKVQIIFISGYSCIFWSSRLPKKSCLRCWIRQLVRVKPPSDLC